MHKNLSAKIITGPKNDNSSVIKENNDNAVKKKANNNGNDKDNISNNDDITKEKIDYQRLSHYTVKV